METIIQQFPLQSSQYHAANKFIGGNRIFLIYNTIPTFSEILTLVIKLRAKRLPET